MSTNKIQNAQHQLSEGSFLESVDQFLDELTEMSARESSRSVFYQHLVDRLQNISGCRQVVILIEGPDKSYLPAIASSAFEPVKQPRRSGFEIKTDDLQRIAVRRNAVCLEQRDSIGIACPARDKSAEQKILLMVFERLVESQLQRVYADLTEAVADIAADFERNLSVEQQQQRFAKLESFVQLISNSHSSLDPKQVAYHLTNDCRSFLAADRVWLFCAPQTKLLSCSGVSDVNQRTRTCKQLVRVARQAIRSGEPYALSKHEATADAAHDHMQAYLESSSVEGIYAIPLKEKETGRVTGVLITEMFKEHDKLMLISGLNNIVPCVESSLSNSLVHSRIPFRRALTALNWFADRFRLSQLPKTITLLGLLAALTMMLFVVKADFTIEVDGELRPEVERHLFAPADGVVEAVLVDYGDKVAKDQAIVTLVSPHYELRIKQLQGELNAARKKLESNQILKSRAGQDGLDAIAVGQLSAEIQQNRLAIEAINENIALYLRLTEDLSIRSPITGQVISRDVKLSLQNRPVTGGNRLLTVADTDDSWKVVFKIPDREFGYLLKAKSNEDVDEWTVDYRVKSEFDTTITAEIESFDKNNVVDDKGGSFVKAFASVDKSFVHEMRVGQTVSGKIHCGRKSLFFIWTRDVRDFLRSNFFWM